MYPPLFKGFEASSLQPAPKRKSTPKMIFLILWIDACGFMYIVFTRHHELWRSVALIHFGEKFGQITRISETRLLHG